jgi:deoxycytidine triphosphate deaminase
MEQMMQTIPFQMEADLSEDGIEAVRLVSSNYDPNVNILMTELFKQAKPRGVWNDERLDAWHRGGGVTLNGEPWHGAVGPASLDLHLNGTYREAHWYWKNPLTRWVAWHTMYKPYRDMKSVAAVDFFWAPKKKFVQKTMWPGDSLLISTFERVEIPLDAIGIVFLRSTSARKGIEHMHAGFLDPNFKGNITLEIFNPFRWPLELDQTGSYVQVALFDLSHAASIGYQGRYQDSVGIVGPRAEVPRPVPPKPEVFSWEQ